ncbi:MAG: hypothetical protein V4507_10835, partial [Verrucomicrobiota bacterium]
MKQKIITAFFALLLLSGIAKAQTATGTITGTISVPHSVSNIESAPTSITVPNAGAYQAILTVTYNNPTTAATVGNVYIKVNGVIFPANSTTITLAGGSTGTFSIPVSLVIATSGANSILFSVENGITSPSLGSITYGPVRVDFYNDATAAATQALVTQQTADLATLTTAVTNLTNTSATQSAALTDLQTRLASLQSTISGLNLNSSAAQLTSIQASLQSL